MLRNAAEWLPGCSVKWHDVNLAASYCELCRRVPSECASSIGLMLFWPWKTVLSWSQSFYAIAKAGEALAHGGQYANGDQL